MSAIEASSVSMKTMADGTLRVTFDIEPRNAQAAFALFGAPGTPAALAALKVGHAAKSDEAPAEPGKGGQLAKLAGMWCGDAAFQAWLEAREWSVTWAVGASDAETAANGVRAICGVSSRAELDNDESAAEQFHSLIRLPYSKHLVTRGVTS